MADMEFKTLAGLEPVEISDRTVKGFASVFGNVDDGGDIVHPGAFTKTLNEGMSRLRFLWQHDTEAPPTAAIKSAREVKRDELPTEVKSKYPQATGGLLVEREYLSTPRAEEILAGYKAGIAFEMSFGYETIKSDFSTVGDKQRARNLRELKGYEFSDVLWGMNPATVGLAKAKNIANTKGMMLWDMLWNIRAGQDIAALLQAGSTLSSDQLNQISGIMGLLAQVLERADEISCQMEDSTSAQSNDTLSEDDSAEYGTMAATYLDLLTHGAGWLKYLPKTAKTEVDREQIVKTIAALNRVAMTAEPEGMSPPLTVKKRIQLAQAKLRILELESDDPYGQHGAGTFRPRY